MTCLMGLVSTQKLQPAVITDCSSIGQDHFWCRPAEKSLGSLLLVSVICKNQEGMLLSISWLPIGQKYWFDEL